jgi:predicted RNA-binding protein YlqC (UPF0109 family)
MFAGRQWSFLRRFLLTVGAVEPQSSRRGGAAMGTEQAGDMRALVEVLAKALVDEPEHVVVRPIDGEQLTVLELSVSANDLGKVIGKQGRTARSIRTILGAASIKLKKRYSLEILE